MITNPPGWTLLPRIDGATLVAPEGPAAGVLRYFERVRPILPLKQIVAGRLRAHRQLITSSLPTIEPLRTSEGEFAAFARVQGVADGRLVEYVLGVVFGDDFYSRVEGFCEVPDEFERFAGTVRELVISDYHFLGVRRRRYLYDSNGWQPIARGFLTDWVSPGFPRPWGMITVYPALPATATTAAVASIVQRVQMQHGVIPKAEPASTASGLVGEMVSVELPFPEERVFSVVALTDRRFLYSAELTSRTPGEFRAHQDAFAALWGSFQPLPTTAASSSTETPWPLPVD